VLATVAGFALCYSYSKELGRLLFKPLYAVMPAGSSLIFTSYQEGFFFI
jgi:sec-independent protein translocase protein TatC